jgi:glutathione S-transferase
MVLTVHHLGISQSERIVFLCEELGIKYDLKIHTRAPMLAPESLSSIPGNDTGKSPFLEDSDAGITLAESGAIVEYIINRYGGGKLSVKPNEANYDKYLHWFHWSNATLQPQMAASMWPAADEATGKFREARLHAALGVMDSRLGESKWLAGDEFTAADIMPVWTLTTQRYWGPALDLSKYTNIVRWLQDIAARPAYQRAVSIDEMRCILSRDRNDLLTDSAQMEKGDPEMEPLTGAKAPSQSLIAVGGVQSDVWKKQTKGSL